MLSIRDNANVFKYLFTPIQLLEIPIGYILYRAPTKLQAEVRDGTLRVSAKRSRLILKTAGVHRAKLAAIHNYPLSRVALLFTTNSAGQRAKDVCKRSETNPFPTDLGCSVPNANGARRCQRTLFFVENVRRSVVVDAKKR